MYGHVRTSFLDTVITFTVKEELMDSCWKSQVSVVRPMKQNQISSFITEKHEFTYKSTTELLFLITRFLLRVCVGWKWAHTEHLMVKRTDASLRSSQLV